LFAVSGCGGSPTAPTPPPTPQLSVSCPAAVEASSLGGQPVAVTYGSPQSTGGTAPVAVTCVPARDALFPAGTTAVTCTAADSAGRQASCTFPVTVKAIPRLLQTRFMAFGDSLTEGKLGGTPFLVDAGPHSYPSQLKRLLDERYTGQTVEVVNEGFGGEVVADSDTVRRLAQALSTHLPGALLLMHGVNDLNESKIDERERIQRTAEALDELVEDARHANIAVFLATLPPLGGPKGSCPECVQPLNDQIRGIAARYGAVLVDVHAAFTGGSALMGADGIHPTEAGYEVLARTFFDAIRRTLEAPPAIR
jgi:lysophospholipase L1-like esterase